MAYDWKKTALKGLEVFVYAGIGGLVSWLSGMPQTQTIVLTVMILKMLRNYLKHKDDE